MAKWYRSLTNKGQKGQAFILPFLYIFLLEEYGKTEQSCARAGLPAGPGCSVLLYMSRFHGKIGFFP